MLAIAATSQGNATAVFDDDADRAAATPEFIGQLGVQLDTGRVYRATGLTSGDWVLTDDATSSFFYIVQDSSRTNLAGDGSAADPVNCLNDNSLKTTLENDTLVPSGSGAIPKFDMAERPSLLRLEYEHPNERRKDS